LNWNSKKGGIRAAEEYLQAKNLFQRTPDIKIKMSDPV
jgi:hypothetical protein